MDFLHEKFIQRAGKIHLTQCFPNQSRASIVTNFAMTAFDLFVENYFSRRGRVKQQSF